MSLCEYCDLYGFTTNLWRGWWRRGCGGLGLLGVGRLLEVLVAILAHLDPLGHVAHSRVLCETKNNLFPEKNIFSTQAAKSSPYYARRDRSIHIERVYTTISMIMPHNTSVQYLDTCKNKNVPRSITNCQNRLIFCQILKQKLKKWLKV